MPESDNKTPSNTTSYDLFKTISSILDSANENIFVRLFKFLFAIPLAIAKESVNLSIWLSLKAGARSFEYLALFGTGLKDSYTEIAKDLNYWADKVQKIPENLAGSFEPYKALSDKIDEKFSSYKSKMVNNINSQVLPSVADQKEFLSKMQEINTVIRGQLDGEGKNLLDAVDGKIQEATNALGSPVKAPNATAGTVEASNLVVAANSVQNPNHQTIIK